MNKYVFTLLLLVLTTGIALYADETEAEVQPTYTETFLNNQYLVEYNRLIALAEQSYAAAKYDEAIQYANEAMRNAQLSDEYVSLQLKIKEVNDAIAATETRMNRAKQTGAAKHYAETFEQAEVAFAEALEARDGEDWDKARAAVLRTIALLDTLPAEPIYPAQYLVRTSDCLWDIAAKPEVYGDPFQWRHIYNANRDKMPNRNNPNLIKPGMLLDIPSIKGELRYGVMEE
jgi:nucleoid-associated protein YgaU